MEQKMLKINKWDLILCDDNASLSGIEGSNDMWSLLALILK